MTHINELIILALFFLAIIGWAKFLDVKRKLREREENLERINRLDSEDAYERFVREWKGQKKGQRG